MIQVRLDHNAIPESQYAKQGNRSIEAAIAKNLYFDYLRLMKSNGAFLAMDLEKFSTECPIYFLLMCSKTRSISQYI